MPFSIRSLMLVGILSSAPWVARAQSEFTAGWYVVQPDAEFAVLQLAGSETSGDSATDAGTYAQVGIGTGEVVLAFEVQNDTYLVYEWFGRLSAVRGAGALRKAPAGGRPAYLVEDVQFLDRMISAGAAVWVTSIDAASGTASIVLENDRRESIPSRSVGVLMNAYSRVLPQLTFKPVF